MDISKPFCKQHGTLSNKRLPKKLKPVHTDFKNENANDQTKHKDSLMSQALLKPFRTDFHNVDSEGFPKIIKSPSVGHCGDDANKLIKDAKHNHISKPQHVLKPFRLDFHNFDSEGFPTIINENGKSSSVGHCKGNVNRKETKHNYTFMPYQIDCTKVNDGIIRQTRRKTVVANQKIINLENANANEQIIQKATLTPQPRLKSFHNVDSEGFSRIIETPVGHPGENVNPKKETKRNLTSMPHQIDFTTVSDGIIRQTKRRTVANQKFTNLGSKFKQLSIEKNKKYDRTIKEKEKLSKKNMVKPNLQSKNLFQISLKQMSDDDETCPLIDLELAEKQLLNSPKIDLSPRKLDFLSPSVKEFCKLEQYYQCSGKHLTKKSCKSGVDVASMKGTALDWIKREFEEFSSSFSKHVELLHKTENVDINKILNDEENSFEEFISNHLKFIECMRHISDSQIGENKENDSIVLHTPKSHQNRNCFPKPTSVMKILIKKTELQYLMLQDTPVNK